MARRVLICGSRDWRDMALIREFVATLPNGTLVIHGACQGADAKAGIAALERGLPVAAMPAPWQFAGKRAGPIRNQWMLDFLAPTEVHAFHDSLKTSTGTVDMLTRAKNRGLLCEVHSHEPASALSLGDAAQETK